jgi:hypothetical protein
LSQRRLAPGKRERRQERKRREEKREGRRRQGAVAGQQDGCLILPYTAAYAREGEEPRGAQRLAIPKLAVCIVVYFVRLRLASRAPVLLVGVVCPCISCLCDLHFARLSRPAVCA